MEPTWDFRGQVCHACGRVERIRLLGNPNEVTEALRHARLDRASTAIVHDFHRQVAEQKALPGGTE